MISLIACCFMTLPNSVVSHSVIQRSRKKQISLEGKKGLNQYFLRIILHMLSKEKLFASPEYWFRLECSVATWTVFTK